METPPQLDASEATPPPLPPPPRQQDRQEEQEEQQEGEEQESAAQDEAYFGSYGHDMLIHEQMLTDEPRTLAYAAALRRVARGKVVLDVGCGSGVLSIFAAQAGAARVYAVEASDMAETAAEIVRRNGAAGVVTVLEGKVENVVLPEPVDVLVSEWMGTALLFESMWESVLRARDRWLKPGGVMMPATVELWAAGLEATQLWHDKVDRWRDVWGLDMSPVIDRAVNTFFSRPLFTVPVAPADLLTAGERVLAVDMHAVTRDALVSFSHLWVCPTVRLGQLHGAVLWFVCDMLPGQEHKQQQQEKVQQQEQQEEGAPHPSGAHPDPDPPAATAGAAAADVEEEHRATNADDNNNNEQLEGHVSALERSIDALTLALRQKEEKEKQAANKRPFAPPPLGPVVSEDRGPLVLSTSPAAPLTHWGHDLLVLDRPHPVERDQELAMRFTMVQNAEFPRHYHLTLEVSPADPECPDGWYERKLFPLWQ